MAKNDILELQGVVVDKLPGSKFKVKVDEVEEPLICTISGKIRTSMIKIVIGDSVKLEVSPYDVTKGRIVWRNK